MNIVRFDEEERKRLFSVYNKVSKYWVAKKVDKQEPIELTYQEYSILMTILKQFAQEAEKDSS